MELLNLKSLKVRHCEKLLTLFPSSLCGRLFNDSEEYVLTSKIEELMVSQCANLKYMFLPREGVVPEDASLKFVFPKLTTIELDGLPELSMLYPGKHTVEGPILKKLEVCDCGQMHQPVYLLQQLFRISLCCPISR